MASFARYSIKLRQFCHSQIRYWTRNYISFIILLLLVFTVVHFTLKSYDPLSSSPYADELIYQNDEFVYRMPKNSFFAHPLPSREKIDWHDYMYMDEDRHREGPGEDGKPVGLQENEVELNDKLFKENGYYAVVSDKISVNRSVCDIRHRGCRKKTYLRHLPTVSIVVPFYNEHFSTLMRTAHSVFLRSPPELLKEIVLVNDHSTKTFLWDELDQYIASHFDGKCKVVHLPERSGLIIARQAGAKVATGDVLIFLDSHSEANYNWLPPLLEPIAENYKICVCPFIDVIDWKSFQYRSQDEGKRGVFDWKFFYKRIPLRPGDQKDPTDPFESPVMAGGLFAISSRFFWELGGYDEGLDIWGGEQYELSFKIWQCGGRMLDAPCSRVGHVYRGLAPFPNPRGKDFVKKNFKRVAEVWMDEYKEYIYERHRNSYDRIDPGDLTKQKAIREKWQCKSFKWFLEEVAPDLLIKYPPVDPPSFARGAIQNLGATNLCVDTLNNGERNPVGMYPCAADLETPQGNQFWELSYFRDIRMALGNKCLDVSVQGPRAPAVLFNCHEAQGNQFFRYDVETQHIRFSKYGDRCLDIDPSDKSVFVSPCEANKDTQKWRWGKLNMTMLTNWEKYGSKLL